MILARSWYSSVSGTPANYLLIELSKSVTNNMLMQSIPIIIPLKIINLLFAFFLYSIFQNVGLNSLIIKLIK